ncbi:MAG: hypothetical protein KF716_33135, partial [Anaerolineae bacterium]|nr:hypothetical protein [Anaerolineae bacterium]
MPTKRFVWKDRDTAALDLIQLVYHAPQYISQQALHILSAIGSNAIIFDLQAIVLDSERRYWERVYALRALANTYGEVYFPDLLSVTNEQLLRREEIITSAGNAIGMLHELYFSNDILPEIIAFAAKHPSNRNWLLNRLKQVETIVSCSVFSQELSFQLPHG